MTDSARWEVIRKAVAFIWNDNNVKRRLPTHLLVECLRLELRNRLSVELIRLFSQRMNILLDYLRDWNILFDVNG